MGDVWQRLARQVVGGGGREFSIERSTAARAAKALAVFEDALSDIASAADKGQLSFDPNGFGRLPDVGGLSAGQGVELGQKFLDRTEELRTRLKTHQETVHHMREMYLLAGDLIEVTEDGNARGFVIPESAMPKGFGMPADRQWHFTGAGKGGAESFTAEVFDKGRNAKNAYKLEDFDSEAAGGVEFRDSGVAWVPANRMGWYDLWDLGRSIKPDSIRAAGQNWIWYAYELRASVGDLGNGLKKASTGWKGEGANAADKAYDDFKTKVAALYKGMTGMGAELAFAAGWLAGTPYGMPSESAPVWVSADDKADPDDMTGHTRGEGYWDFLTSLTDVREYYKNSYLAGFMISRKRIPQFTPPKAIPRTDPNKKTDPHKKTDPKKKTDPNNTGERPGQRVGGNQQPGGNQQQPGGNRAINKGSKTIQQGVQDVNKGVKTIQQGIQYVNNGAKTIQQGQTDLARGLALIQQGRIEKGNELIRQGKQKIAQGEAEIKKGKELIEQGKKEVRAGQEKLQEGQKQIKDAEKALRDAGKQDTRAAQAIKQAEQYLKAASQADAAGDQHVKAGQNAITEGNKLLPSGQNSTEPSPLPLGPGETGGQQAAGQQGIASPGQQPGAGLPGQQQSGAQDGTAALAGIALAAGAFAQAAGQGVQAIIQAGIAAASQMEQLGTPVPDAPPIDPDDGREPKGSDESKATKQHDDGSSTPPGPEPVPDRQTNLFPQSNDPPGPLPPAPVIEPLVLPSQEHPLSAAPYMGSPAKAGPDAVQAGASLLYSARYSDEPRG